MVQNRDENKVQKQAYSPIRNTGETNKSRELRTKRRRKKKPKKEKHIPAPKSKMKIPTETLSEENRNKTERRMTIKTTWTKKIGN